MARQDPPDRRGADTVTELEQFAPDPHVSPARVLPGHPHHQGGEDVVDRWPSGPVRVGPSSAHEAAMPAQDRVGSDQEMATQRSGHPPHESGEHGPVRPVHTWSRVGSPEDSDLMTQHEHLTSFEEDVRPSSRTSPSTCRKIRYSNRNDTTVIVPERRSAPLTAGQRTCATFWNPTGVDAMSAGIPGTFNAAPVPGSAVRSERNAGFVGG